MNKEDLQTLVARGESERVEFKKSTGQRSEAAKTVCALLNGAGGFVVFGVTDRGELVGQQVSSKTLEDLANEWQKIDPPPDLSTESIETSPGRTLLIVSVPGGSGLFTYDGRPYMRSGPTTQRMDRRQYERLLLEEMHPNRRWEKLPAVEGLGLEDLDAEEIQAALENAVRLGRMRRPKDADSTSILLGFGLIEDGLLLNAALALFGKSPRVESNFPQFSIRMARFRGTTRTATFTDNRQYWGNAFSVLRRGEDFLLDHVPVAGQVISGRMQRVDTPLYPPRATREALANAICHRDYAIPGASVAVAMYDDHLEIENPDGLHFGLTPEALTHSHPSRPWNPLIAEVFYRTGVIEKWGTGTLNMMEWCQENGNPPPQWEVQAQSAVVVTFLPAKEQKVESGVESKVESGVESRPVSLQEKVLQALSEGPLSKSDIAHKLGKERIAGQLHEAVKDLLTKGVITYTIPNKPNSRLQKYRLVKS